MILCPVTAFPRYAAGSEGFQTVAEVLRTVDLKAIPEGRTDLDGDRVFVLANHQAGLRPQAPLEVHRRHIDIQVVVCGADRMGWAPLESLRHLHTPYDPATDIAFYDDAAHLWFPVLEGHLAVFFPEDAHAPLVGSGPPVHKLVFKVRVS